MGAILESCDCGWEPACPDPGAFGHVGQIVWSSDGSHFAFSGSNGGAWVVGSDGSGLEMLAGRDAGWSPSGSQIAFQLASGEDAASFPAGGIAVVTLDG